MGNLNGEDLKLQRRFIAFFFLINLLTLIQSDYELFNLPSIVDYSIIVSVLLGLTYYGVKLGRVNKFRKGIIRGIVVLYLLFCAYLVLSSIQFDLFYIQLSLKGIFYLLPYLLPLLLLQVRVNEQLILTGLRLTERLLPFAIIVQVIFLIVFGVNEELINPISSVVSVFQGWSFLLLFSSYNNKEKGKFIAVIFYLILTMMMAVSGRRTPFILHLITLGLFTYFYFLRDRRVLMQIIKVIFFVMPLTYLFILFNPFSGTKVVERGLSEEAFNYSRGSLFDEFREDFSMDGGWFFGRGLNGTVKRSIEKSGVGNTIENGFYTYILKGGVVFLALFLLLLLSSAYFLLRDSRMLSKGMGLYIVVFIIGMTGFNIPVFHVNYLSLFLFSNYALTR